MPVALADDDDPPPHDGVAADVYMDTFPGDYENAQLLGSQDASSRRRAPPLPRRSLQDGWATVLGYEIPIPLLVMFLVPPLTLLLAFAIRLPATQTAYLPVLSNGTHEFHSTTLLISVDGFRPSYLETHAELLPNLIAMGKAGLHARSMQPIFPTLTFPNHWAILTGLYAESHGIVANNFYAPDRKEIFSSRLQSSWDPAWWWGEPMWSVAERGGRRSVNMMWPGPPSTSAAIAPSYFVPFKRISPMEKLPTILHYFDKPIDEAPSLILSYLPDIDQAGHKGGPDSDDVNDALKRVDEFLGALRASLEARHLGNIVDVVLISDHGMMGLSTERRIFLDDILGEGFADLEYRDGWPSFGLRFKEGSPVDTYVERLRAAANESFAVYTHETMPERWHFHRGNRVAPVYLVPDLGWVITDHKEVETVGDRAPKGAHGFDNTFPEMQAVFFAEGPWAEAAKKGDATSAGWETTDPPVLKPFSNLEIFSLIMKLQRLENIAPPTNSTAGFWL